MKSTIENTPGAAASPGAPPPGSERSASDAPRLGRLALVLVLLIALAAVGGLIPRWVHANALRNQTSELAMLTVDTVLPAPGKAGDGLTLPAEVRPLLEAPIYARASGYLKRWLVDIGAPVKEGDLLAEIDTPELNQELAQTRAQLGQAEAALALAKTTAARWADLVKTASVSEQEASEKQADLALKSAMVEAAGANVRRLEELQRFQRVTAPFAGIVTARTTDVGNLVTSNAGRELFRLAQTAQLRVYVRVPQTAARAIVTGQKAELLIAEIPGSVFPATVVRTSGAMSVDSRTLLTELAVDNAKGEILAGSYAQVRFSNLKPAPVLTLPANTLLFRAEGLQVGVVDAASKVQMRNVKLGRDFGPTVEILEGLTDQDRVVLNPPDSLVGGVSVRLAQAATAPGVGMGEGTRKE